MALFAIADLHLSLATNKPMDVFSGWQNYTIKLEQNWNKVVSADDTVVIAGDISWAMKLEESVQDFAFINALPGKKIILKGNHDYWWTTKSKIDAFLKNHSFNTIQILHNNAFVVDTIGICGSRGWLYNAESDEDRKIINREVGRLNASIDAAEKQGVKPIAFLHYPPVFDGVECSEILKVLETRNIKDCYFGHIHGSEASKRAIIGEYNGIKMHLISCDYLNFLPMLVR